MILRKDSEPPSGSLSPRFAHIKIILCLLCSLISMRLLADEGTVIQERLAAQKRWQKPLRLSFGPEDSYLPTRSKESGEILFTTRSHSGIQIGLWKKFGPGSLSRLETFLVDAEQAVFSPSGKKVLFFSVKPGQPIRLCYREISLKYDRCLGARGSLLGGAETAFWLSEDRIGYQRFQDLSAAGSGGLFVWDTVRDESVPMELPKNIEGPIVHPSGAGNGSLVFVQPAESRLTIVRGTQICSQKIPWPGTISYPRFSEDGESVVFSAHIRDSNADGFINAEDNSSVGQVSVSEVCEGKAVRPLPLISSEFNCSHARLSGHLDFSCSYEGSLDIYTLPREGQLPRDWKESDLVEAHLSARSGEERLFVLFFLWSKYPRALKDLELRIFNQYLLLKDPVAAMNWLALSKESLSARLKPIEEWLKLLNWQSQLKREPKASRSLELSDDLSRELQRLRVRAGDSSKSTFNQLMRLSLAAEQSTDVTQDLLAFMKHVARSKGSSLPHSELLLLRELWQESKGSENEFLDFLLSQPSARDLPLIPLWIAAFQRLEEQQNVEARIRSLTSLRDRVALRWPESPVLKITEGELLLTKLIENPKGGYRDFDALFSSQRSNATLLRWIGYRAIDLLTRADLSTEAQYITRNLLRFLNPNSLEWSYAYDYFVTTAFDRAYESEKEGKPKAAIGHFYSAMTMGAGLEAHWGYFRSLIRAGMESDIEVQISDLAKRRFLGDQEQVVRSLARLARSEFSIQETKLSDRSHQQVAARLRFLSESRNFPALRDPMLQLILGVIEVQEAIGFKTKLDELRLDNLILALDSSMDNPRIRVLALESLALVRGLQRKWGEAHRYWQLLDAGINKRTGIQRFFHSRALFHLGENGSAFGTLEPALNEEDLVGEWRRPIHHRGALYAYAHFRYSECSALISKIESDSLSLTKARSSEDLVNSLQALILKSACALKTEADVKLQDEARMILVQVWDQLQGMKESEFEMGSAAAPSARTLLRLKILTSGFLTQFGELKWFRERQKLLEISPKESEKNLLPAISLYELRLKNQLLLWSQEAKGATVNLVDFLKDMDDFRDALGVTSSDVWYESLQAVQLLMLTGQIRTEERFVAEVFSRVSVFLGSVEKSQSPTALSLSHALRLSATTRFASTQFKVAESAEIQRWTQQEAVALNRLKRLNPMLAQKTDLWIKSFKEGRRTQSSE